VPLSIIQRRLGRQNLGVTSIYLQGINPGETIHARRPPMLAAGVSVVVSVQSTATVIVGLVLLGHGPVYATAVGYTTLLWSLAGLAVALSSRARMIAGRARRRPRRHALIEPRAAHHASQAVSSSSASGTT
jgi:hypothetical protein